MKKKFFDFVESGYFTSVLFVLGAIIGIAIGTGFFTKLGTMNGVQIAVTVILAVGGAFSSFLWADALRKRLYEWENAK